jgi:hypothetical protein
MHDAISLHVCSVNCEGLKATIRKELLNIRPILAGILIYYGCMSYSMVFKFFTGTMLN